MASSNKVDTVAYISRGNKITETKTGAISAEESNYFNITDKTKTNTIKNGLNSDTTVPHEGKSGKNTLGKKKYNTSNKIDINRNLSSVVNSLNKTVNLPTPGDTVQKSFLKTINYYNRFKIANPNSMLQKGFAHVFFVRPSCNIINSNGKGLTDAVSKNELFSYAWQSCPQMLKQLSITNGQTHDFMMSLSNSAASFSLSDEYINADTYGKTYTGYKIAYGKNNIESKTAGNFSITFNDDRQFHIYQLHRLWVEYINGVYRGEIAPDSANILNKILDYVSAVYYFVTAEDGETIIFWTKYYGVFPTTIPSTQYSWAAGNVISNPTLDITYNFSFKEDYNPYTIMEFNRNSNIGTNGKSYVKTFDAKLGTTGDTWVGSPFIEVIKDTANDIPYQYKLRFHKRGN